MATAGSLGKFVVQGVNEAGDARMTETKNLTARLGWSNK